MVQFNVDTKLTECFQVKLLARVFIHFRLMPLKKLYMKYIYKFLICSNKTKFTNLILNMNLSSFP